MPNLTIKEFAKRQKVSVVTVRRWINAGIAPLHIRCGRTIRFRPQEIEAWETRRIQDSARIARDRRAALLGIRPKAISVCSG